MHTGDHIAFFTRYLPNMGGVEFFTDNLARQLARDGYKPIVITTDKGTGIDDAPFEIIRLDSLSILNGRYPIPINTNQIKSLKNRLIELNVKNFVINGRFYPLSAIGAKLARELNACPLVIDHSSAYVADTSSLAGKLLAIADHISTHLLNRYQPKFYCVSKRSSQWIQNFGLNSEGEIHNAINAESFIKQAVYGNSSLIDTDSTPIVRIAFAGRLIPEKGVMQLIEAMNYLPSGVELHIAGSGPLESIIKTTTESDRRIKYLGRLSHPDLALLLTTCDIFCFPTKYGEGLPTCLLEAAACNCALITTDTGGTAELIPNAEHGIVLKNTNPEIIAEAILELINDRDKLSFLKEKARKHIEHNFSWSNTESQLLSALDSCQP